MIWVDCWDESSPGLDCGRLLRLLCSLSIGSGLLCESGAIFAELTIELSRNLCFVEGLEGGSVCSFGSLLGTM